MSLGIKLNVKHFMGASSVRVETLSNEFIQVSLGQSSAERIVNVFWPAFGLDIMGGEDIADTIRYCDGPSQVKDTILGCMRQHMSNVQWLDLLNHILHIGVTEGIQRHSSHVSAILQELLTGCKSC